MGNSGSSKKSKSKRRDFLAAHRADKLGPPAAEDGSMPSTSQHAGPSPARGRANIAYSTQATDTSMEVEDDDRDTDSDNPKAHDLEQSFHGQSKIQRLDRSVHGASVHGASVHGASLHSGAAFGGSVHGGDASVHGEDWSYHGKAQVTRLPPRDLSGTGLGLGGTTNDYSISKSQRAKKSMELLLQSLSIDESRLVQPTVEHGETAPEDVHVKTGKKWVQQLRQQSRACCSRFGLGRDAFHAATKIALDAVCEASGWDYGELWVVEEKTSMLRCCGHTGFVSHEHRARLKPLLHSVQNQLVESASFLGSRPFQDGGRSVWVPDLSAVNKSVLATAPAARFHGLKTCVAVPLVAPASNEVLGYVMMYAVETKLSDDALVIRAANDLLGMVADLLVAFIRFSRDGLNNQDYREAVKAFLENEEAAGFVDGHDSLVRLKTQVLFGLGIVEQHLSWAHSMDSVDHKTCIQVLAWLAKNSQHLSQSFAASAFEELVLLLKYLATVSPVKKSDSPIRSLALEALDNLREYGFILPEHAEPPWFGPGTNNISPVASNLHEFKTRLSYMFAAHPRRDFLLKYVESHPPPTLLMLIDMRVGEVFTTVGTHDGAIPPPSLQGNRGGGGGNMGGMYGRRSAAPQKSESAMAAEVCTAMLRASGSQSLFTVANLIKLHGTLSLDFANASGVLRTEVAVGSHRFFESYRVFAPAQEIEQLLELLENEMASEALSWHPAQQAFYVFGALVWFIHPFLDGNGRTARLFGNMVLKKYGLRAIIRSTDKVVRFEDFLDMLAERIETNGG